MPLHGKPGLSGAKGRGGSGGWGGADTPCPGPCSTLPPLGCPCCSRLLHCRGLGEPVSERVQGGAQGGMLLAWRPSKAAGQAAAHCPGPASRLGRCSPLGGQRESLSPQKGAEVQEWDRRQICQRPARCLNGSPCPQTRSLGDLLPGTPPLWGMSTPLDSQPLGSPVVYLHPSTTDYLNHVLQVGKLRSREEGDKACVRSPRNWRQSSKSARVPSSQALSPPAPGSDGAEAIRVGLQPSVGGQATLLF